MSAARKMRVGERYGRLLVVEQVGRRGARYLCRCACGRTVEVVAAKLLAGHTRSCGCLRRELAAERLEAVKRQREAAAATRRWERAAGECATPGCRAPAGHGLTGCFCVEHAARLAEIRAALGHEPTRSVHREAAA